MEVAGKVRSGPGAMKRADELWQMSRKSWCVCKNLEILYYHTIHPYCLIVTICRALYSQKCWRYTAIRSAPPPLPPVTRIFFYAIQSDKRSSSPRVWVWVIHCSFYLQRAYTHRSQHVQCFRSSTSVRGGDKDWVGAHSGRKQKQNPSTMILRRGRSTNHFKILSPQYCLLPIVQTLKQGSPGSPWGPHR